MDTNRRTFLHTVIPAGALAVPKLGRSDVFHKSKLQVAMVDTSRTVKSFSPALKNWPEMLANARRGDRIVLGLVMGEVDNQRAFRLVRDVALPEFDFLKSQSDNARLLKEALDYLDQGMEEALNQPRSNRTELLRTFREVARYCAAMPGSVLECTYYSDMLEDSNEAVFEKSAPSDVFIRDLVARKRSAHDLPDLRGLKFRAVGVTAPSREIEDQVSKFWHQYLFACGATVIDYGYQVTTSIAGRLPIPSAGR